MYCEDTIIFRDNSFPYIRQYSITYNQILYGPYILSLYAKKGNITFVYFLVVEILISLQRQFVIVFEADHDNPIPIFSMYILDCIVCLSRLFLPFGLYWWSFGLSMNVSYSIWAYSYALRYRSPSPSQVIMEQPFSWAFLGFLSLERNNNKEK